EGARGAAGVHRRAVRQRPNDPDALYRLGASEFTAGAFAAAVELLARARAVAPRRADIAIKLAQALEQSGETTQALGVMDAIIDIRPEDPFLHFVRGLIRSRGGRYDGAIADLEIVVRDDPDLHRAHYALARALLASGRTGAGRAEMERFIAADEQRRREETALSAARLAGASSDDSPVLFRRRMEGLVQADPTSAEANRQLALAYSREGDDQMAEITFARASRLDPQDVKSRRLRGQLLLRMDRAAEAVTPLVEAARLAPDDETIRRLLVTARREASAAGRTNSP
ncbi:MAG: tetratricopeptide repeat protein, partial [Acidobacteriota bacterium]